MFLSMIGFGILCTVGAGAVIISKGIKTFVVYMFAFAATAPILLLLRQVILKFAASGPKAPIEQVVPSDFWIYLIPMGIFIIARIIYFAYEEFNDRCDEKEH